MGRDAEAISSTLSKAKRPGVLVRLPREELAEWHAKAKAAGVSLSALIRQAMHRTQTWTAQARDIEQQKVLKLAKIGNNLNQLARWANTYKHQVEALEVLGQLSATERELRALRLEGRNDAD